MTHRAQVPVCPSVKSIPVRTNGGKAENSEPMLISGLSDPKTDEKSQWSGNFRSCQVVGRDEQGEKKVGI